MMMMMMMMKKKKKKMVKKQPLQSATVLLLLLLSLQFSSRVARSQRVPAMFVFGDSLVDDGNNNFLNSIAKSNYYPYGIDFRGPTGRFTNGRTVVDLLAELLGVSYPQPYADPGTTGAKIFSGVNYASAAAGILDETGQNYGQRFSLSQQVLNFETTMGQMRTMANATALSRYLAKSIVIMVFGSNDYLNNYLMPSLYPSSYNYNPPDFANLLLNHYARQILALYGLGLRKFYLAGIGPLGCMPNQRALAPPGRCLDYDNEILGTFNEGLRALVNQLNGNHPGSIFVYGNSYGVFGDILNNPAMYGFNVVDRGCCGLGRNLGQITCMPMQMPCMNRKEHVFWDAFHPTEAANNILSQRAFYGPPSDCYPINVQQMALI